MSKLNKLYQGLFLVFALLLVSGCDQNKVDSQPPPGFVQTENNLEIITPTPPGGAVPTQSGYQEPTEPVETDLPAANPTPILFEIIRNPEFQITGIEMHSITNPGGLEFLVDSGAYWVRRNGLLWSKIEELEGERNWAAALELEKELINASQNDLEVILVVRSTPEWAQAEAGYECGRIKPGKLTAFADFLEEAVARYSKPPYNVKYWEIWNEPGVDPEFVIPDSQYGCMGDMDGPNFGGEYYAEILKAAYPKIKQSDPKSKVLVGGLLLDCDPINPPDSNESDSTIDCGGSRYLEGIFQNGGGQYFDGVSFHAYDYYGDSNQYGNPNWNSYSFTTGPVLILKTRFLKSLLQAYGHPGKFLINTESGLICGQSGNEDYCKTSDFQDTKAYYAAQANAAALAEGLLGNVWYSITGWRESGLIDKELVPLPVYSTLKFSAQQLENASLSAPLEGIPGVMGYEFSKPDGLMLVLWSMDGNTYTIQLDEMPENIYDIFGNSLEPSRELDISPAPVYVHK